nr:Rpn family recombination-promoting nuclease/putative transposase [Tepidanaerobacter syntrophicus]
MSKTRHIKRRIDLDRLVLLFLEIWETKVRKEQLNKLPIIIPLVIYHGKERWKASAALKEMKQHRGTDSLC